MRIDAGASNLLWKPSGFPARVGDRPVPNLAGNHQAWLKQSLDIKTVADHDAVFGKTAAAFYGIDITS